MPFTEYESFIITDIKYFFLVSIGELTSVQPLLGAAVVIVVVVNIIIIYSQVYYINYYCQI